MENNKPIPIEQLDPELGELLRQWCNGELRPVPQIPKVGRNDPCPCGAIKNGKRIKFKKCQCSEFHPK